MERGSRAPLQSRLPRVRNSTRWVCRGQGRTFAQPKEALVVGAVVVLGAAVLDDKGEICGLIDDKDCLNTLIDSAYYNQPVSMNKVSNYMTNVFKRINVNSDIADVANLFIRSNFKRLLVVDDDGKLVGSISRRDVLRAIKEMEATSWR